MRADLRRVAVAALGLMLTGAVAGGVLGAVLLMGYAFLEQGAGTSFGMMAFLGGGFGALFGAFLAPLVGLLVLPSVPPGRALLETALGTLIGGMVGFSVPSIGPIPGAVAGFFLAAARLHVVFARRRREADPAHAVRHPGSRAASTPGQTFPSRSVSDRGPSTPPTPPESS